MNNKLPFLLKLFKIKNQKTKLLLVCNPGGHFSSMKGLREFWENYPREWVTYHSIDTQQLEVNEKVHWVLMQEARMIGRACINFIIALFVLQKSRPTLVISTGASLAVPFICASKIYGIRTVFIESISRSRDLSLSGKLVYNLVDEFYVQWPECQYRFPKAKYQGVIV